MELIKYKLPNFTSSMKILNCAPLFFPSDGGRESGGVSDGGGGEIGSLHRALAHSVVRLSVRRSPHRYPEIRNATAARAPDRSLVRSFSPSVSPPPSDCLMRPLEFPYGEGRLQRRRWILNNQLSPYRLQIGKFSSVG